MLNYLFRQFVNSCGIFFRTIRAFFTRKTAGATAYLRRATNFSRKATKVATASFQGAAAAVKKPSKREDYVETGRLFISKSFLILAAVALVALGVLIYYVAWPFVLSHFLTAKFYQQDERLVDWSGKVIVYYDEDRRVPMYSGTLEEGILQGRGREFDEDGLLIYEGGFADGERSGTGSCYDAGVLIYDGQFLEGVYAGSGSLYEDGLLVYEGAFAGGAAAGYGTAYDQGNRCYEGMFAAGEYSGEGTAYHSDGQTVKYKGAFAAGAYEGQGVAYTESGTVLYRGGFAAGEYDGSGSLYLDGGDVIRAEFSAGAPDGAIQWYKAGKLWYDGGAEGLIPDGFGTVYAKSGKILYAGELDRGTLDGAWLLGLTAEELREAFGGATLTEADGSSGFRIINKELGLSALCSYRQEDEPSQVYQLWFQPEGDMESLLPWATALDFTAWASVSGSAAEPAQVRTVDLEGKSDGTWQQTRYNYEGYHCAALCAVNGDAPERLVWVRTGTIPAGGGGAVPASQSQARMDALLDALDGGGSGGDGETVSDVEKLLSMVNTAQAAEELVVAMTDWFTSDMQLTLLTESRGLLAQILEEAQTQLAKGQGSEEEIAALTERLADMDRRAVQYTAGRERAALTVEKLTGEQAADHDLRDVLMTFDPVELEVDKLYSATREYVEKTAEDPEGIDGVLVDLELKTALIDLGALYEETRYARQSVERAAENLDTVGSRFAKGTANAAALYEAQILQNETMATLIGALGSYTNRAAGLNTLSGGWVAETYEWQAEPFAKIFQGELSRAQAAALERQARQKAEEDAA